jgi:hypothetical protein
LPALEHRCDGFTQSAEAILLRDQNESFADSQNRYGNAGAQAQLVTILLGNWLGGIFQPLVRIS